MRWMIYGATGYTGKLVAQEAVKRGHKPVLAGRSTQKLKALAQQLNLDYRAFDVDDVETIASHLEDIAVVYHTAGPFIHTSDTMIQACLRTKTYYLDITGEYAVFENTFHYDTQAQEAGIVLISGVGFDVVPSDCLCKYVADQLPDATELEIAIHGVSKASAGTTQSALEMIGTGGRIRRDGDLLYHQLGSDIKPFRFPDGERQLINFPWGDLATAYRTTGIPNITTYFALSNTLTTLFRLTGSIPTALMGSKTLRSLVQKVVGWGMSGPSESLRNTGKSVIYAKVCNANGDHVEAWLETIEAYLYTAKIGVLSVERVLNIGLNGATTPALAFGKDFALEVEGTVIKDTL